MRRLLLALLVAATPASGQELVLTPAPVQGGLALGRVAPGSVVTLDSRPVPVAPDGEFVLGFGRDATQATLEIARPGAPAERRTLEIARRRFDVQRVDGLPQARVTPDPAALRRIAEENAEIARARTRVTREGWYRGAWSWPATGPISGVYGSQRILNGEPRSPHWGVDVAAPSGTPVLAPADGEVSLVQPDNFLTGGTVIVDHGYGLNSVYAHLSAIDVTPGERVRRGQRLGAVGATGRTTGPHLHWGINWFEVRLDPALLVPPMPSN